MGREDRKHSWKSFVNIILVVGIFISGFLSRRFIQEKNEEIRNVKRKEERVRLYYNLLNDWMKLRNRGELLGEYFKKNGYDIVAIYGMGELGYRLYGELKEEGITVAYGIDKNKKIQNAELPIAKPDENLDFADVIVVTPIHIYSEIKQQLEQVCSTKIISLYDVIDEVEIMYMEKGKSEDNYA